MEYDEYRQAERMLKKVPELVNERGRANKKAIEFANSERMIRLLVKYGADPNDRCMGDPDNWLDTKWDDSKLQYMWMGPNWGVVKGLISVGGDINCREGSDGMTALHGAAEINNAQFVKYLIENGADVHAKDDHGQTPLHYVAFGFRHDYIGAKIHLKKNPIESVKVLIEHGADINASDENHRTLLDCLNYESDVPKKLKDFLRASGAKTNR